jgi:hypothetical protein
MGEAHRSSIRPSRSEQPITMRMAVGRYSLCHEGSPGSGSLVARMADWSGVGLRLFGGELVEQTEDQPDRRLVVTLAECLSGGRGVGEPFRPWPQSDKRWDAVSHQHPVGPQARRPAIDVGERMDLDPLHVHEGSGGQRWSAVPRARHRSQESPGRNSLIEIGDGLLEFIEEGPNRVGYLSGRRSPAVSNADAAVTGPRSGLILARGRGTRPHLGAMQQPNSTPTNRRIHSLW